MCDAIVQVTYSVAIVGIGIGIGIKCSPVYDLLFISIIPKISNFSLKL